VPVFEFLSRCGLLGNNKITVPSCKSLSFQPTWQLFWPRGRNAFCPLLRTGVGGRAACVARTQRRTRAEAEGGRRLHEGTEQATDTQQYPRV